MLLRCVCFGYTESYNDYINLVDSDGVQRYLRTHERGRMPRPLGLEDDGRWVDGGLAGITAASPQAVQ